jgi:hypothetical protein
MKKRLHVGLLIDSYILPIWAAKMLKEIIASDFAKIELVIISDTKTQHENKYSHITTSYLKALNITYKALIERQTYLPNALEEMQSSDLLSNIDTLLITPTYKSGSNYFDKKGLNKLKPYNIDVYIHLTFNIIKGDLLKMAKYGVWSHDYDDNKINENINAGFWESMVESTVTNVSLQILNDKPDDNTIIAQSVFGTNTASTKDNTSSYFWKYSVLLPRKLKELHQLSNARISLNNLLLNSSIGVSNKTFFYQPSITHYSYLILKKIFKKINILYDNHVYKNQWGLLFNITEEYSTSFSNYKQIIPPKDRFWADPHIIYRDDKYYIYIEEALYKNRKGHISLIEMDENGNYKPPKKIIEQDYHMSYPHIVEYENDYYMIPETADNAAISIYKCVHFPDKWEFQMHLMENIKAYDATLLYKDNLWWIFTNVVESDGISSWDELFIFSSPELLSDQWKPHIQNPVISDCRSSRPAGKIFEKNGRIYRPSQNSSVRYGYGLKVNEIIELSQDKYEERLVSEALPDWDKSIIGLHTFNREGNLNIIDAIYKRKK